MKDWKDNVSFILVEPKEPGNIGAAQNVQTPRIHTQGNRDMEERIMKNRKRLIGRTGLTDRELRMLHGICSQAEEKLGNENKGQA